MKPVSQKLSLLQKPQWVAMVLLLLILATFAVSLGLGSSTVSFDRLLPTLFGQGTFKDEFVDRKSAG